MSLLIARQPIFDKSNQVFGYELLYRETNNNAYSSSDGDSATSSVITGNFLEVGISKLTGGKRAFINFTEYLLKQEVATLFPREYLVVELLETVEPTDEIVAACKKLKEAGYVIALDDFVFRPGYEPLIKLADIIKVDFLLTKGEDRRYVITRFGNGKIKFLAEKIENREEFELALKTGYSYFQGYYFSKPIIISSNAIPPNKINHLQLIRVLDAPDPEFKELAGIIERDTAFSYEILKLVNSALLSRGNKITSIRQAVVRLGMQELKKWAYIAVLRKLGENQGEAINYCSVRAKSMELLCQKLGNNSKRSEYFTVGILSMIDVLMGTPMSVVLNEIPLSEEIKNVLLNKEKQGLMAECYNLILAYERGEWGAVKERAEKLNLSAEDVAGVYYDSVMWLESFN